MWVVAITGTGKDTKFVSGRLSKVKIGQLVAGSIKRHREQGIEYNIAGWYSKDNQTSGEAPLWEVSNNTDED